MDLKELTDLISVRQYVCNATALPAIDRKTVTELNGILLLLDKKIIGILLDTDFKDYVDYKNVQAAKEAAVRITSIYSGIQGRKK
jgi:hypothetical protein